MSCNEQLTRDRTEALGRGEVLHLAIKELAYYEMLHRVSALDGSSGTTSALENGHETSACQVHCTKSAKDRVKRCSLLNAVTNSRIL
jgi:hypothetical protein